MRPGRRGNHFQTDPAGAGYSRKAETAECHHRCGADLHRHRGSGANVAIDLLELPEGPPPGGPSGGLVTFGSSRAAFLYDFLKITRSLKGSVRARCDRHGSAPRKVRHMGHHHRHCAPGKAQLLKFGCPPCCGGSADLCDPNCGRNGRQKGTKGPIASRIPIFLQASAMPVLPVREVGELSLPDKRVKSPIDLAT